MTNIHDPMEESYSFVLFFLKQHKGEIFVA